MDVNENLCSLCYFLLDWIFLMKTSVPFWQSTSVIQILHTKQRGNAFVEMQNHSNVSLQAEAHLWTLQLKILVNNQAKVSEEGVFRLQMSSDSSVPPSHPGSPRAEGSGSLPKPIPLPPHLPGQQSKVTENAIFSWLLQGANILKSKHSRYAEASL